MQNWKYYVGESIFYFVIYKNIFYTKIHLTRFDLPQAMGYIWIMQELISFARK
jgi:hypothetical protein